MNNAKTNNRPASPPADQPPSQKHHTTAAIDNVITTPDAEAMASRFDKWKRPKLSQAYESHSTNIHGEFSKMAPFRILSFDIECPVRGELFPEAIHDPVIKVANLVTLQGEVQPLFRNVMTLKSCSSIDCVAVMSFDTEREVLLAWRAMHRDHILNSYKLNDVCAHFLGEQKEDAHFSDISNLQNGSAETRRKLAVYRLKDAYLPQRLLDKLMYIHNYVEMARVTGVPISYLLSKGPSIKVTSQRLSKAKELNLVIPITEQPGTNTRNI